MQRTINGEIFAALIEANGLTRKQAGDVIGTGKSSADSWLLPIGSKHWRNMSDDKLEKFKTRLPGWMKANKPGCRCVIW